MVRTLAPALQAFAEHLIDYAGLFPPAALSLDEALDNYSRYRSSEFSWILGRFVVDEPRLHGVPDGWEVALLADQDHARAGTIESKRVIEAGHPLYCEVPIEFLHQVKRAGANAKLRCSGRRTEEIAAYLRRCADLRLPLKFTAGLHSPFTNDHGHGFVNVFVAAFIAYSHNQDIESVLDETDPSLICFGDDLKWGAHIFSSAAISRLRYDFAHSFGSCSFEEPVAGLKTLGWL